VEAEPHRPRHELVVTCVDVALLLFLVDERNEQGGVGEMIRNMDSQPRNKNKDVRSRQCRSASDDA